MCWTWSPGWPGSYPRWSVSAQLDWSSAPILCQVVVWSKGAGVFTPLGWEVCCGTSLSLSCMCIPFRIKHRLLHPPLNHPRRFPRRQVYFPGRGSAHVDLISLKGSSTGTSPILILFNFFSPTQFREGLSFSFGCIGDLLPVSKWCSVSILPHVDFWCVCVGRWAPHPPTPPSWSPSPLNFRCDKYFVIRKVIQNQRVGSYMSQRGRLLERKEESVTWIVITKHYYIVSETVSVNNLLNYHL